MNGQTRGGFGAAEHIASLEGPRICHLLCDAARWLFHNDINNDEDDDREDAENQGADVQALGGGGVGLGPSRITHHLPVPRLEETRLSVALELAGGKTSPDLVPHHLPSPVFLLLFRPEIFFHFSYTRDYPEAPSTSLSCCYFLLVPS